jgi:serine/threonine protein kinase
MNDRAADVGELAAEYRDITPLDDRPEGERYRATLRDGRDAVVTLIASDLTARLEQPQVFLDALRGASRVAHAAFPTLVHSGRTPRGTVHVAVEYQPADLILPGTEKVPDVAAIGAELARALHAAHVEGIMHGAVSTQRIARTSSGVQLDGLGLFTALCTAGLSAAETASTLSEAVYVAPEVRDGEVPSARSDVYSLGASLYELLTGKPPFGGRTTSFVMATVLADEPTQEDPTSETPPTGPVVEALLRAIETTPADRWPDAGAFAAALAAGAGDSPGPAGSRRGCLSKAGMVSLFLASIIAAIGAR